MSRLVVDGFGGPGGWAEGLRSLGIAEVGIEIDPWACATRAAAGHRTIRADITTYPTAPFLGRGRCVSRSATTTGEERPVTAFRTEDDTEPYDLTGGALGVCLATGGCVIIACPVSPSHDMECHIDDGSGAGSVDGVRCVPGHVHVCADCGFEPIMRQPEPTSGIDVRQVIAEAILRACDADDAMPTLWRRESFALADAVLAALPGLGQ